MKRLVATMTLVLFAGISNVSAGEETETFEGVIDADWFAKTERIAYYALDDKGTARVEVALDGSSVQFDFEGAVGSVHCVRDAESITGSIVFRATLGLEPMELPCNNAQAAMDALAAGLCDAGGFANAADFSQQPVKEWAEIHIDGIGQCA